MKAGKPIRTLVLTFMTTALLLSACAPGVSGAAVTGDSYANTITVSGVGKSSGDPDMATVTVGVNVSSSDISGAVTESNATIDAITEAIAGLGVGEHDIQTVSFNIWPEDRYDPSTGELLSDKRYHVDSTVQVIVRDIDTVSRVLEQAIANGANSIYGLQFGIQDTDSLANEARADALADARTRAEQVAAEMGVDLGDVVQVTDQTGGYVYPSFEARGLGGGGGDGPPISEGSLTVTVNMSVTYAISR